MEKIKKNGSPPGIDKCAVDYWIKQQKLKNSYTYQWER